jgi:transposase-like protein
MSPHSRKLQRLSREQKTEIVSLYRDTSTTINEIASTYGTSVGGVYSALRQAGISSNRAQTHPTPPAAPAQEEPVAQPAPAAVVNTAGLAISVDKFNTVVSVTPEGPGLPWWEISYQGTMRVRAASIEEAIRRAHGEDRVKRIVAAREVQP